MPRYSKEAGYGRLMAERLEAGIGGKVFVVGDSSVAHREFYQRLYIPDMDGVNRFFSTIDAAVAECTANAGDTIFVLPGHSETFTATDLTLDVAGVSVIGLGQGSDMPNILFNHAAAEISVAADNVRIENMRFTSDITAVAIGIEIEDGVNYATVRGCVFDVNAAGTDEFNAAIHMVNNNTGCVIEGNTIDMGAAGAVAGIHMDADTAKTVIRGNIIRGDYSTANIAGDTTLSTNVLIEDNILVNGVGGDLNAQPTIELLTGTTGVIKGNLSVCNVATLAAHIVADTCLCSANERTEDAGGGADSARTAVSVVASADD